MDSLTGQDLEDAEVAQQASVVRLVNEILLEALESRASDVHVESEAEALRIRYRIDGVLRQIRSLHRNYWSAIAVVIGPGHGISRSSTELTALTSAAVGVGVAQAANIVGLTALIAVIRRQHLLGDLIPGRPERRGDAEPLLRCMAAEMASIGGFSLGQCALVLSPEHADIIAARAGAPVKLTAVADKDPARLAVVRAQDPSVALMDDAFEIVTRDDVDVVVDRGDGGDDRGDDMDGTTTRRPDGAAAAPAGGGVGTFDRPAPTLSPSRSPRDAGVVQDGRQPS